MSKPATPETTMAQLLEFEIGALRSRLIRDARAAAETLANFADRLEHGLEPMPLNGFTLFDLVDGRAHLVAMQRVITTLKKFSAPA